MSEVQRFFSLWQHVGSLSVPSESGPQGLQTHQRHQIYCNNDTHHLTHIASCSHEGDCSVIVTSVLYQAYIESSASTHPLTLWLKGDNIHPRGNGWHGEKLVTIVLPPTMGCSKDPLVFNQCSSTDMLLVDLQGDHPGFGVGFDHLAPHNGHLRASW